MSHAATHSMRGPAQPTLTHHQLKPLITEHSQPAHFQCLSAGRVFEWSRSPVYIEQYHTLAGHDAPVHGSWSWLSLVAGKPFAIPPLGAPDLSLESGSRAVPRSPLRIGSPKTWGQSSTVPTSSPCNVVTGTLRAPVVHRGEQEGIAGSGCHFGRVLGRRRSGPRRSAAMQIQRFRVNTSKVPWRIGPVPRCCSPLACSPRPQPERQTQAFCLSRRSGTVQQNS